MKKYFIESFNFNEDGGYDVTTEEKKGYALSTLGAIELFKQFLDQKRNLIIKNLRCNEDFDDYIVITAACNEYYPFGEKRKERLCDLYREGLKPFLFLYFFLTI